MSRIWRSSSSSRSSKRSGSSQRNAVRSSVGFIPRSLAPGTGEPAPLGRMPECFREDSSRRIRCEGGCPSASREGRAVNEDRLRALDAALQKAPENAELCFERARTLEKLGRRQEALD